MTTEQMEQMEQMERVARVIEGIADLIDRVDKLPVGDRGSIDLDKPLAAELRLAAGLIREQPAEVARLRADNARLRALLPVIEWVGGCSEPACSFCGNWDTDGHAPDCPLKAELDRRDLP